MGTSGASLGVGVGVTVVTSAVLGLGPVGTVSGVSVGVVVVLGTAPGSVVCGGPELMCAASAGAGAVVGVLVSMVASASCVDFRN